MTIDGKIVFGTYDHMMDEHVPSPPQGDCPNNALITPMIEELYSQLQRFVLESNTYGDDGPLPDEITTKWFTVSDTEDGSQFYIVMHPNHHDKSSPETMRIDGAGYRSDNGQRRLPQDGIDWTSIELLIELMAEPDTHDPFDEEAGDGQGKSHPRQDNFAQISVYAATIFAEQHRLHHFTLLILGHMARIVRWDRSGVFVTHKFDYTREPLKLARFLWRFAHLTDAQRGRDPTATPVLRADDDYALMCLRRDTPRTVGQHAMQEHARSMFAQTFTNKTQPYRLEVYDEELEATRFFLVGEPFFASDGLIGRGTRGYVALETTAPEDHEGKRVEVKDWPNHAFVWLKDSWRIAHEEIEQEGSILRRLNDADVPGVPHLVCHHDVEGQMTWTQRRWLVQNSDKVPQDSPLKTRAHYRLVVQEVCLPMHQFENGEDLVYLLARCIRAHYFAWKAGFIHRDISAGNVLIMMIETVDAEGNYFCERDGMLADWELSTTVVPDGEVTGSSQVINRTGTWQFLPVEVLQNPSTKIVVAHEMESFFYVLLWYAVRFLPHNCENVGDFISKHFDDALLVGNEFYCGVAKRHLVRSGKIIIPGTIDQTLKFIYPAHNGAPASSAHPMNDIVSRFLQLLRSRYRSIPSVYPPATLKAKHSVLPVDKEDIKARSNRRRAQFLADFAEFRTTPTAPNSGNSSARTAPSGAGSSPLAISKEDEMNVEMLNNQMWLSYWLMSHLYGGETARLWSEGDKTPDQLARG